MLRQTTLLAHNEKLLSLYTFPFHDLPRSDDNYLGEEGGREGT